MNHTLLKCVVKCCIKYIHLMGVGGGQMWAFFVRFFQRLMHAKMQRHMSKFAIIWHCSNRRFHIHKHKRTMSAWQARLPYSSDFGGCKILCLLCSVLPDSEKHTTHTRLLSSLVVVSIPVKWNQGSRLCHWTNTDDHFSSECDTYWDCWDKNMTHSSFR